MIFDYVRVPIGEENNNNIYLIVCGSIYIHTRTVHPPIVYVKDLRSTHQYYGQWRHLLHYDIRQFPPVYGREFSYLHYSICWHILSVQLSKHAIPETLITCHPKRQLLGVLYLDNRTVK